MAMEQITVHSWLMTCIMISLSWMVMTLYSLGLLCVALYRLHVVAVYIIYYIATSS